MAFVIERSAALLGAHNGCLLRIEANGPIRACLGRAGVLVVFVDPPEGGPVDGSIMGGDRLLGP